MDAVSSGRARGRSFFEFVSRFFISWGGNSYFLLAFSLGERRLALIHFNNKVNIPCIVSKFFDSPIYIDFQSKILIYFI
jgi:hypothetical protein